MATFGLPTSPEASEFEIEPRFTAASPPSVVIPLLPAAPVTSPVANAFVMVPLLKPTRPPPLAFAATLTATAAQVWPAMQGWVSAGTVAPEVLSDQTARGASAAHLHLTGGGDVADCSCVVPASVPTNCEFTLELDIRQVEVADLTRAGNGAEQPNVLGRGRDRQVGDGLTLAVEQAGEIRDRRESLAGVEGNFRSQGVGAALVRAHGIEIAGGVDQHIGRQLRQLRDQNEAGYREFDDAARLWLTKFYSASCAALPRLTAPGSPDARAAKNVIAAHPNEHAARKYKPAWKLPVESLIQPTTKGPT